MRLLVALTLLVAGCAASTEPSDASVASDAAAIDAGSDAFAPMPCGASVCGPGEICVTGRCAGCCDLPPSCVPTPTGCTGALSCGCFAADPCGGCTTCGSVDATGIHCVNCMCACAAAWTPIDTPDGPRSISELRIGDLVLSLDRGEVVVVPITRVRRQAVVRHALVRVTLASGERVEMSGTHPTADGRRFDTLSPGDRIGDDVIASVETVPYDAPVTHDILPRSDSGAYRVHGAWIGSTLHAATRDLGKSAR